VRTLVAAAAAALIALSSTAAAAAAAYSWPIKPFDQAHAIRGGFGDPRTRFYDPLNELGLNGPGDFAFHNGVDIAAPGGTPVYSVVSGVALIQHAGEVVVAGPNYRRFQYQHITPTVVDHQQVVADVTVIGHVQAAAGHVHLAEIDSGVLVNPLLRGHLQPYRDLTKPRVENLEVTDTLGNQLNYLSVHGGVVLTVEAYDRPQLSAGGTWSGMPLTPATVAWRLWAPSSDQPVVPTRTVVSFTKGLPTNSQFWTVYARGTYQNQPRIGGFLYRDMPGRFIFNLTPDGVFDTTQLKNGPYEITVTAIDVRGHMGVLSTRIFVRN
jgi:hypothetical protein